MNLSVKVVWRQEKIVWQTYGYFHRKHIPEQCGSGVWSPLLKELN